MLVENALKEGKIILAAERNDVLKMMLHKNVTNDKI